MATTKRAWKRKMILGKIEGTPGTDAVPTPTANAVEARKVSFTPLDASYTENNAEVPYFGNSPELPVSAQSKLAFEVAIQGSGTAGVAPAFGPMLRACGFAEVILAAPVSGTAQAGGANTITLAATASATDNAYRGLRLVTDGGTGSGQANVILAYDGTTKVATMVDAWGTAPDATTTYTLPAQVAYVPVSDGHETLTQYVNMDGVIHKIPYCQGNVKIDITPKNLPKFAFDFLGLFVAPEDEPLPAVVNLAGYKQPNPVTNAWTSGARLHGVDTNVYSMNVDLANKTKHRDDVVGVDDVLITDRGPGGAIVIQGGLLAEKDWFTSAQTAALGSCHITHGVAAGRRMRLVLTSTQVKAPKPEDKDGTLAYNMDLRPCPVYGNDEIFLIFD